MIEIKEKLKTFFFIKNFWEKWFLAALLYLLSFSAFLYFVGHDLIPEFLYEATFYLFIASYVAVISFCVAFLFNAAFSGVKAARKFDGMLKKSGYFLYALMATGLGFLVIVRGFLMMPLSERFRGLFEDYAWYDYGYWLMGIAFVVAYFYLKKEEIKK